MYYQVASYVINQLTITFYCDLDWISFVDGYRKKMLISDKLTFQQQFKIMLVEFYFTSYNKLIFVSL